VVKDLDTIARGNAAEAAVLRELTLAGFDVFLPFGGGTPFDLIAVLPDGALARIQVKSGRVRGECVLFNTAGTDHGRGRIDYRGRADLLAVYVAELDRVFVTAVEDCPSFVASLRLKPTRNNQRRRVRLAEDYLFGAWVESLQPSMNDSASA
jgi:hypothetical protein